MSEALESITMSGRTLTAQEAQAAVGRNFTSYWRKWAVMAAKHSTFGWNWAAFFLGPVWLGYRRMHKEAALAVAAWLAVSIVVMGVAHSVWGANSLAFAFLVAVLAVFAGHAISADNIYFFHVVKRVDTGVLPGLSREQSLATLGGVSPAAAAVWAVVASVAWLTPPALFPGPPAPQQQVSYFSEGRFKNPVLMSSLYEHKEGPALSTEMRLANALYVKFAADRLNELCGWQPKSLAAVVKGTLDVGVGVILTAGTLDALSKMSDGQADAASKWIEGVSSFDLLRTYARADTERFLADNANCTGPDAVRWADGVNWYLSAVAPKLVF